jgi:hypothetical protein
MGLCSTCECSRQRKMERDLLQMLWKVKYTDLDFSKKNARAAFVGVSRIPLFVNKNLFNLYRMMHLACPAYTLVCMAWRQLSTGFFESCSVISFVLCTCTRIARMHHKKQTTKHIEWWVSCNTLNWYPLHDNVSLCNSIKNMPHMA